MSIVKSFRNGWSRSSLVCLLLFVVTSALAPAPAVQARPLPQGGVGQDLHPGFEASLPGNADPVFTAEERLWQQIEAAYNAGDRAALTALIQELAQFDLPAAIRLAQELTPPAARPAPAPVGPISREEELQQAAVDAAQRAELLRQEAASRAQALRPTPADDEKWATPPGDTAPQRPAATLTVGDNCTYATVYAAVNVAASGDTIRVQGKTYTGVDALVNINAKSLTLSGGWNSTCTTQGSTKTTLDATGQYDTVVEVFGGAVPLTTIIDNFILQGSEPDLDFGGGLEIDSQNTVTLRRTSVRWNDSDMGGGIHMSAATVLNLEQSTLVWGNNALQGDGGGIHCTDGAINISGDSIIGYFDNTASGNGGGLYLDNCTVYLNSTASETAQILHNTASGNGGGIYALNGSYINLRGSNAAIAENSAGGNGGGVYLAGASDLYVDNGSISLNTAGGLGGGVYATDDLTTVDMDLNSVQACSGKCTQISNNTATSYGGAVYLTLGADLDFNGVYAEGNSGSLGSAFYARGEANVLLSNVMATGNTATSNFTLRLLDDFGAPEATVRNSTFAGNSGQSGSFGVDAGTSLDGDELILWANSDTSLVLGSGDATIDCSVVQFDYPGSNNLVDDPDFWDPAGGDYHIARTSSAVDHCSSGLPTDVDGDSRPFAECVDCEAILDGPYDAGADEAMVFVGIDGAACAYPTVGSAISAASSGATIYISPGVYMERLGLIDKDLVLTAATNDCAASAASGVTIDANDAAATNGGVAQIGANRTVTLANLTLTDGTATLGGIVYVGSGAHLVLDNTDLSSGSASSLGGGLRVYNSTVEMINASRILGSETTGSNGGGAALAGGTLILRDASRIGDYQQSNTAAGLGGGVYLDGGLLQMEDTSRVRSNTATTNGGGVYALNGGDILMDDSASIGWNLSTAANSAVDGGGVYLTGAGATLTMNDNSGVQYNTASADGGGIYVTGGASVTVDSARVTDNQAVERGGGIMVDTSATVTVQNGATVNGNQAAGAAGLGGGLYILGDGAAVTVDASQVNSNVAGHSYGGIRVFGASSLNLSNGATLNSNQAQTGPGGGLSLHLGAVTISSAVIQSNIAAGSGGGIYMDSGAVTITNPDIRYNQAASGPGGGIYRSDGLLNVEATTQTSYVAANTSATNGGGIYDASSAPLVLRALDGYRLNINSNQAGVNGGGIYALHTFVNAYGWIQMTSNTAANHGGALYLGSGATAWFDDYNTANVPEIWVNTATSGNGGGIYAKDSTRVELDGGQVGFAGGGNRALAGDGGGIYLDNSDLLVDNTIIVGNQAGDDGGGVAAVNTSSVTIAPTMGLLRGPAEGAGDEVRSPQATLCDPDALAANTYCTELRGNSAADLGGGIFFQGESTGSIARTAFIANTAALGSALELYDSTVSLHNSLVSENVATGNNPSTIHVYNEGGAGPTSTFHAQHNTIANNSQYGIFYANTTGGTFDNNIVWGNTLLGFVTGAGLATTATCNDTQDSVLTGAGNVSADPRFITTARGDYHLKPGSPALDACAAGSSPDLDAIIRPRGAQYDMGALELWCASGVTDVDGSGKTDIVDVGRVAGDFADAAYLPQHDINCDGAVTVVDVQIVATAWTP